ncbi:PREDICTED: probable WRKY transcription factor 2 [Fragaria vesca subsp. vesca]|uniref:probable WRKY transcription factor 2 n=1 Tax=Fragaria vesca subsp. vesca TaxID=101020 RepID=UPI0002C2F8C3|nr:PREDICTED: probable WRKY transcription factor 2 [Fragaria vesca subsp. vesca]XP_011461536.1 PREDICTED: probable WRKY transcription factor 2 [Fragaria vesca subsp. vesca]XP_011461537.1 PREDICTED: probable WRKY transcription factor 2 [Fragaria vesca subsp. vesca]
MAGMDDNVAIIGDWVPPSPSPRDFFSSMLVDGIGSRSFLDSPNSNKAEDFFLGSREGSTSGKNLSQGNGTGDEITEMGSFSEYKSNTRGGLVERIAARAGFNAPRLNTESIRSSDLSLSSDVRSPYLTIPPGLSPTTLLDSPVFLSNSLAQPSPTTGKFPFVSNGHGRNCTLMTEAADKANFFEDLNSSFAFKPLGESGSFFLGPTSKRTFPSIEVSVQSENSSQNMEPTKVQNQNANNFQLQPDFSRTSTEKDNGANTVSADPRGFDTVGGSTEHSPPPDEQPEEEGDQRGGGDSMAATGGGTPSEDGYNWRKYGQKQVKGSEYPRSYYKCTHPNCQVKKKVERSHEGHITEIIYKGAHNHPKPPPNRRSGAIGSSNPLIDMRSDVLQQGGPQTGADGDLVWASAQKATGGAPDWKHDNLEVTSSASAGPDYGQQSTSMQAQNGAHLESGDVVDASSTFSNDEDEDDRGTHGSVSLVYDGEGDESESKRRKIEAYATEMSGATRAIREPRVVVQTTSEVDILDDGYRWRKYGQKVVKGNPNPRSYYKCTNAGCTVRKHVERASHDLKSVITTYEGKHNHDVPAARNSSHVNSGPSGNMPGQVSGSATQTHPHRPEPSQVHNSMARFERPMSMGSFSLPGRQQLGPPQGFSFGMNQPGLANLAMAGFGPGQHKVPVLPVHHPYFAQQRQVSEMGFMLPKGEPKVEPISEPGLNMSNASSVYQQLMSRLPLGPQM